MHVMNNMEYGMPLHELDSLNYRVLNIGHLWVLLCLSTHPDLDPSDPETLIGLKDKGDEDPYAFVRWVDGEIRYYPLP